LKLSHIPCVSRHACVASLYLASSHSDSASGCRDPCTGRRNSDCAAALQDQLVEAFSAFSWFRLLERLDTCGWEEARWECQGRCRCSRERELGWNGNSGLAGCSLGLVGRLSVSNPQDCLQNLCILDYGLQLWVNVKGSRENGIRPRNASCSTRSSWPISAAYAHSNVEEQGSKSIP